MQLSDHTVLENAPMIIQTCTYSSNIKFYCPFFIDLLIQSNCYILISLPTPLNMNFYLMTCVQLFS